jgi:hypothetical protein
MVHVYLADTCTKGEQPKRVMLSIFIALYEDYSLKAIHAVPTDSDEFINYFSDLMTSLSKSYTACTMQELKKCKVLQ